LELLRGDHIHAVGMVQCFVEWSTFSSSYFFPPFISSPFSPKKKKVFLNAKECVNMHSGEKFEKRTGMVVADTGGAVVAHCLGSRSRIGK